MILLFIWGNLTFTSYLCFNASIQSLLNHLSVEHCENSVLGWNAPLNPSMFPWNPSGACYTWCLLKTQCNPMQGQRSPFYATLTCRASKTPLSLQIDSICAENCFSRPQSEVPRLGGKGPRVILGKSSQLYSTLTLLYLVVIFSSLFSTIKTKIIWKHMCKVKGQC